MSIRAISQVLQAEILAAEAAGLVVRRHGGIVVDGQPFWEFVASVASRLGARCDGDGQLHGPVLPLNR